MIEPKIREELLGKETFYLGEVCVLPEFQRRRIAKALITRLALLAAQAGYSRRLSLTHPQHAAVISIFTRLGMSFQFQGKVTLGNAENDSVVYAGPALDACP